ncbi:MAG: hypothetical protein ACPL06_04245 [Candidatus Anstonellales archaeon]
MREIYSFITNLSYERVYTLKEEHEFLELCVVSLLSFAIPFFIPSPQLLTGALVNSFIIFAALRFKGKNILPVILLPSIAAFSRGLLFGPFTIFLAYLIPFIWIGNAILLFSIKYLYAKLNKNYFLSLLTGALLKSSFLFASAFLLYSTIQLPAMFLEAMGILQFATALIGGVLTFVFTKIFR